MAVNGKESHKKLYAAIHKRNRSLVNNFHQGLLGDTEIQYTIECYNNIEINTNIIVIRLLTYNVVSNCLLVQVENMGVNFKINIFIQPHVTE